MPRIRSILTFALTVAVLAALVLAAINARAILDRVAPFDLGQPRNWATGFHLYLFRDDPKECFDALDRGKVDYVPALVRPIVTDAVMRTGRSCVTPRCHMAATCCCAAVRWCRGCCGSTTRPNRRRSECSARA